MSITFLSPRMRRPGYAPPGAPGWARRGLGAIPSQGEAWTDGAFLFDEIIAELRSSANGGAVSSATGQDIRFERESDATKHPHDIIHYDPSSGRLVAWVRPGSVPSSGREDFRVLVGKAGQLEENRAGAWTDVLAAWTGADGSNREGTAGRDLVHTAIGAGTRWPFGGAFDGSTSHASHADGSFVAELTEIEIEILHEAGATGHDRRLLAQGPHTSDDGAHGLLLRYDAAGYFGGGSSVIKIAIGVGTDQVIYESASGVQSAEPQHLLVQWKSGEAPKLYINGQLDTPTWWGKWDGSAATQNATVTGSIALPVGTLELGGLTTNPWLGEIGFLVVRPTRFSAARALYAARNALDPPRGYGLSSLVADGVTDNPPIAMPVEGGTQAASTTVDYDVAASAVDLDADPITLDAATGVTGSVASASVVGGQLRVTTGSQPGPGRVGFQVNANLINAARFFWMSTTSAGGYALPTALRTVIVSNQTEFNAALAAAIPGDHIVCLPNITLSGPGDWTKSGTTQDPIVVRCESITSGSLLTPRITGSFNPNGSNLHFVGLDMVAATMRIGQNVQSNDCVLHRMRWRDHPESKTIALRTDLCHDLEIGYCEWSNWGGRGISFAAATGTRRPHLHNSHFHHTPAGFQLNSTEAIQLGFGQGDLFVDLDATIETSLFEEWDSDDECISSKSSGSTFRQLRFKSCRGRVGSRLGMGCRWEALYLSDGGAIRIHDGRDNASERHLVLGCKTVNSGDGIQIAGGTAEPGTQNNYLHNLSEGTHVAGCDSKLTINAQYTNHTLNCRDTRIREHTDTITLRPGHENTDSQPSVSDPDYTWLPVLDLTAADVGPFAGLA